MKTKMSKVKIGKHIHSCLYISGFETKELKDFIKNEEFKNAECVCFGINDYTGNKIEEIKEIMKKTPFEQHYFFSNIFVPKIQKVY